MRLEYQIVLAFLLDAFLGKSHRLPNPVRLIEEIALRGESFWRWALPDERRAGVFTVVLVLWLTGSVGWLLLGFATLIHPWLGALVGVYMLYSCFDARNLMAHSRAVYHALKAGDLVAARQRLDLLLGRDTDEPDRDGVEKDGDSIVGVAAPVFFAVLGGPAAALVYKAINTMDSLFGHKEEHDLDLGRCAARLNDLANYLPVRLAGLLMVAAACILPGLDWRRAWRIFRDRSQQHTSLNSGRPEAVVAAALGVLPGGANRNFGQVDEQSTIGDARLAAPPEQIEQTWRLLLATLALTVLLLLGLSRGLEFL